MASSDITSSTNQSPRFAACLEGFLAMMMCLFAASGSKSLVIDSVSPSNLPDVAGFLQACSTVVVLVLLYGPRFRPPKTNPPSSSTTNTNTNTTTSTTNIYLSVLKSLFRAALKPGFIWEAGLILLLHITQVLVLWKFALSAEPQNQQHHPHDDSSTTTTTTINAHSDDIISPFSSLLSFVSSCASTTTILWAPIFEEMVFRVIIFYVVLHRSGGSVGLSCLTSACTFGAIHIANVWASGGTGYSWLQVTAGIMCGLSWTLIYAATGSIPMVCLLHTANNIAAVSWASYASITKISSVACSLTTSTDSPFSIELVASQVIQTGVYAIASMAAWRRLHLLITRSDTSGREDGRGHATTNNTTTTIGDTFKQVHPIVYGDDGNAQNTGGSSPHYQGNNNNNNTQPLQLQNQEGQTKKSK